MEIQLSDHFDYKKLIKFTLPVINTMLVTSIFGSVDDGFFVSNFAGKNAFAAINIVIPGIMILGTLGFMIGSGGTALVSKLLGEGEKEKANQVFSMLLEALIIFGIIVSAIFFVFIEPVSVLLGADEELLPYCVTYGRIQLLTLTFSMLQMAFQNFLSAAERPKLLFKITLTVCILNTVCDFFFVYLFRWGVVGASLATAAGQVVGGLWPMIFFMRKNDTNLRFSLTKIQLEPLLSAGANGLSEMVNDLSMSLINILYNYQLIKLIGNDGVVAYGVIMYVGFIFVGVFVGYSMGVAPIISYHYGAHNEKELQNLYSSSIKMLIIAAVVLTTASWVLAKPLAMIFTSYDQNLLSLTTKAIQYYCSSYLIAEVNIFASSLLTALNNGKLSALISFARSFLFQVIMIFLLPKIIGVDGIWVALVAAEVLTLIITVPVLITQKKVYHY